MHKATSGPAEEGEDGKTDRKTHIRGGVGNAFVWAKRYYSNNVTDIEKQQAFNLFHGIYRPTAGASQLWDETDLVNSYDSISSTHESEIKFNVPRKVLSASSSTAAYLDEVYDRAELTSLDEYFEVRNFLDNNCYKSDFATRSDI